jgi:hypothetical protein
VVGIAKIVSEYIVVAELAGDVWQNKFVTVS